MDSALMVLRAVIVGLGKQPRISHATSLRPGPLLSRSTAKSCTRTPSQVLIGCVPMPSPLSDDRAPQAIKSRPGEDLGSAEVGVAPRPGVLVSWHLGVSGRSILVSNLFPEPPPGILPRTRWNAEIIPSP